MLKKPIPDLREEFAGTRTREAANHLCKLKRVARRDSEIRSIRSHNPARSEPEEESLERFKSSEGQGQPRRMRVGVSKAAREARARKFLLLVEMLPGMLRPALRSGRIGSPGPVVRAGCAPFAFAVTADSGPSQSRRWHPARNTRHGPIRKVAAATAAPVFHQIIFPAWARGTL